MFCTGVLKAPQTTSDIGGIMSKNLVELKPLPCPFCGDINIEINYTSVYWCSCVGCGAEAAHGRTQKESIKIWNRRTP
jgi:Lar family restriction alleviation protein